MEIIKDFLETWADRIRSPVLATILISVVVANWDAFYFLMFSETTASVRINYFRANTDVHSFTWIPACSALAILIVSPWLKWLGAWWARAPRKWIMEMEKDEAISHQIYELNKKTKLETERANLFSEQARAEIEKGRVQEAKDQNLLNQTKRGQEAANIGDQALANAIVEKRDSEMEAPSISEKIVDSLTKIQKEIVLLLGENENLINDEDIALALKNRLPNIQELFDSYSVRRLKVDVATAYSGIKAKKIAENGDFVSGNKFKQQLTSLGYKVFDILNQKSEL